MSESQVPSRDAAELLESVVELGLPSSRRAVVPAHRRRRHAFRQFAQDTARGEVTVPPTLLSPAQRKLHIRDTVIEDHLLRMRLVPSAVSDKLRALAQDPFTFFRGTALLYYRDIAGTDAHLPFAPTVGDVHPENFGILPGGDGQPLFDLNDMDEAWAAPFTWDLQRGAVGFALAAGQLGAGAKKEAKIVRKFSESYLDTMGLCARDPEAAQVRIRADNAPKVLRNSFAKAQRSRGKFLSKHVDSAAGRFRETERIHRRPALAPTIHTLLGPYRNRVADRDLDLPTGFFDVLDVAVRSGSGTASRGLARLWVLVSGFGDVPVIIELKMSRHSALDGLAPEWGRADHAMAGAPAPAQRIAEAFAAFVPNADPLYGHAEIAGVSFLIRERGPQKVNIDITDFDLTGLKKYAKLCGATLARLHVRAAGLLDAPGQTLARRVTTAGSARVFGSDVADFVAETAAQVRADHRLFVQDWRNGAFDLLN
ncbi:DUF2252 family protein [uncultured Corynebacterium sp.]|uniref:DUF2252 family protein n=1 Tax=uncultured Corynebacterium sp. TaxID=159447 RepID=UPI00288BCCA1|nr:DUF2252 family protein [uncultured Corynebacterium sp.]